MRIPGSWNREAHRLYLAGRLEEAVNLALRDAGMHVERFVQAMYYVYMHGDYRAGLVFCREFLKRRPGDVEMLNQCLRLLHESWQVQGSGRLCGKRSCYRSGQR